MNTSTSTCPSTSISLASRLGRETAWLMNMGFKVNTSLRRFHNLVDPSMAHAIHTADALEDLIAVFDSSRYALGYGFDDGAGSKPFWFLAFPALPFKANRDYANAHGMGFAIDDYGLTYFTMHVELRLNDPAFTLTKSMLASLISFEDSEGYVVADGNVDGIFPFLPLDVTTRLSSHPIPDMVSIRYLVTKPDLTLAADCELYGLGLDYAKDTGKFYVKVPVTYVNGADMTDVRDARP